ncbi:hypothetical protein JHK82_012124 [Glycine max]|nr:hypothetical protein JHK85_012448 [Glycine max]KAG5057123.1 hypothetical protein JHK86_012119 [Glycine max]KAG5154155.1 hypothetical protein JHK82_012124 [Glycine max]
MHVRGPKIDSSTEHIPMWHLNMVPSQLHPNNWVMLTGKIGWVLLNSASKKMFEFDSNMFRIFKDCFFKVKVISVIIEERAYNTILEQFPALLDVRAILSLPLAGNPLLFWMIEARVDPSSASDIDEDEVVEVTLDVPLLAPTKRKRNEGVEGSSQRRRSPASSQSPPLALLVVQVAIATVLVFHPLISLSLPIHVVLVPSSTASATSAPSVVPISTPPSSVTVPLLSAGVTIAGVLVFVQRSLAILDENGQRHKEALSNITTLEVEVTKWRATAQILWKVKFPKVANAIVALVEAIRSNYQLLSRVDDVFAKLVSTRLDGNEVFKRYKYLLKEKNDFTGKVERAFKEKEVLKATVTKSAKEFELEVKKEKEANKELEEELLMFKKEVMEQHEKGFLKAIKQAGFFTDCLDIGLFDPFKDVKDGQLLDEEEIAAREDNDSEEEDKANV